MARENSGKPWTEDDERTLREKYNVLHLDDLAALLKRPVDACRSKAHILGLGRRERAVQDEVALQAPYTLRAGSTRNRLFYRHIIGGEPYAEALRRAVLE